MRHLKVRSKLLVSFALLSVFCTGLVTYSIYSEMRPYFLEAVEVTLIDTSRLLASQLAVEAERAPGGVLQIETVRRAAERMLTANFPRRNVFDNPNQAPLRLLVADSKGLVLFDSHNREFEGRDFSAWRDIHLTLQGKYGARATRLNPDDPRTSTHFVAAPVIAGGRTIGVVSVGKPVESVAGFLRSSNLRIALTFLGGLCAALLLSAIAALWISRPLLRLESYVRSLSTASPLPYPRLSADEVGSLGETFENLRKELEGKQYVERYVHNLTHEIKSPLTGLIGAAELLSDSRLPEADRRQLLSNLHSDARRLQDLAEKLLELASLEARARHLKTDAFDLKLLVEEVVESFETQARLHRIEFDVSGPDELIVTGERFLIWRALANLLQNAIDFSPAGGRIAVRAESERGRMATTGGISICVQDQGPGIPDYAIVRITEKFFSLERPRTGKKSSGLGLSFANEVMSLHRGNLIVESTPQGTLAKLAW